MALLAPTDPFPALTVPKVGGGTISLPGDLAGSWGVVLVNRGSWCPFCNTQLSAFQRATERLDATGIRVVSFSVDDEPAAAGVVDKHKLTFPVGHSADATAVAAATGAFVDPERHFLQATGFVLDPRGRVLVSVYSSGAIGRLMPDDVIGLVEYTKSHA
jgi:peroxiredoxin